MQKRDHVSSAAHEINAHGALLGRRRETADDLLHGRRIEDCPVLADKLERHKRAALFRLFPSVERLQLRGGVVRCEKAKNRADLGNGRKGFEPRHKCVMLPGDTRWASSLLADDPRDVLHIVPKKIGLDSNRPLHGLRNRERACAQLPADLLLRVFDGHEPTRPIQDDQIGDLLPLPSQRRDARLGIGGLAVVIVLQRLEYHLNTSCELGWGTSMTPFTSCGRKNIGLTSVGSA